MVRRLSLPAAKGPARKVAENRNDRFPLDSSAKNEKHLMYVCRFKKSAQTGAKALPLDVTKRDCQDDQELKRFAPLHIPTGNIFIILPVNVPAQHGTKSWNNRAVGLCHTA
jgi:hypothetical protein